MKTHDTLIIGAGIAGLSAARGLAAGGTDALLLERSRGVGGRCATRRVNGAAVDHGVAFLHGSSADFIQELESVDSATPVPGWPRRVEGDGRPCQTDSLRDTHTRIAFREGVSALPKWMARGLDIRLETEVEGIEPSGAEWVARVSSGETVRARRLILALAAEQSARLIAPMAGLSRDLDAAIALFGMTASLPCLTVLAGYGAAAPAPAWDMLFPEKSNILQLVSHDSSKRCDPEGTVLVLQARSCWSRRNIDTEPGVWCSEMLREASEVVGDWTKGPEWVQTHCWRMGRIDRGNELTGPLLLDLPGEASLGLAGDLFGSGGGVESAWLSGRRLAERMKGESRE